MSAEKHPPHIIHNLIGTGLFTGYIPFAPGTVGSAMVIIILWFIPGTNAVLLSILAAVIFFVGVKSAGALERDWGKDERKINIDEIAGMTIALIGLPKTSGIWLSAFIIFRVFDIFKPPPIRLLEFSPGGWGVMIDDVAAGIYANIACRIIVWIV